MDKLPASLTRLVCRFACESSANAAPSLLRVSKHVRESALPYRYLSLALLGRQSVLKFLLHIREAIPGEKVPVNRVLVSDRPKNSSRGSGPSLATESSPDEEWDFSYAFLSLCRHLQDAREFCLVLQDDFDCEDEDLRYQCLDRGLRYMPRLSSLTLYHSESAWSLDQIRPMLAVPSLETLHLVGNSLDLREFAMQMPFLKSLRLSAQRLETDLAADLAHLLCLDTNSPWNRGSVKVPKDLKEVHLELETSDVSGVRLNHAEWMIKGIAQETRDSDRRLVLRTTEYTLETHLERILDEWLGPRSPVTTAVSPASPPVASLVLMDVPVEEKPQSDMNPMPVACLASTKVLVDQKTQLDLDPDLVFVTEEMHAVPALAKDSVKQALTQKQTKYRLSGAKAVRRSWAFIRQAVTDLEVLNDDGPCLSVEHGRQRS